MWPSATTGAASPALTTAATNHQNYYTIDFDPTTQEFAEANLAMPSDYNAGTVTAKFYWTATGTSTASVVWQIQGNSYGDLETIDATWGTAVTAAADPHGSTASMVQITSATGNITLGNTPAASELVMFRVARVPADGSDTLAVDAQLIGIMVSYTRS